MHNHHEANELPVHFDGRKYNHREIKYDPSTLRSLRPRIYILTDKPEGVVSEFSAQTNGVITDLQLLNDNDISESAFYIYFSRAELALPFLRRIVDCKGIFAPPPMFAKSSYLQISAKAFDTFNELKSRTGGNPFGTPNEHAQICQAVEITKNIIGDFVEIGVFSGCSARTALTHMRNLGIKRTCWLLDTYNGFQYETAAKSSDMIWNNTHIMNIAPTIEYITDFMKETEQTVHVVQNDICENPLPSEISSIAIANIDVDLYEAVLFSLQKIAPLMVHRGVIIVEDPPAVPGLYGAFLAMHEFLDSELGKNFVSVNVGTQYFLIRVS